MVMIQIYEDDITIYSCLNSKLKLADALEIDLITVARNG